MLVDLRYAVRSLLRNPPFAISAIGCLALATGAAASVFSLFDAVLLRPLDFPNSDRLVALRAHSPKRGLLSEPASGPDFRDWREQGQSFESMAAFQWCRVDLPANGQPRRLEGLCVTNTFLPVLAAGPTSGRSFSFEEQQAAAPVVLISHALWRDRFNSDPAVEGRTLELRGWRFGPEGGRMHTIAGVLPEGLRFFPTFVHYHIVDIGAGAGVDFILPLHPIAEHRSWRDYDVIARLKPGVTVEQAQAEMNTIASRIAAQYPLSNEGWGVSVVPLHDYLTGNVSRELTLMFGAVGLVLLIGFVSFIHFHAERGTSRSREMATRMALGATPWRILRQWLIESLLLSLAGGGLGLLLARWGTSGMAALAPANMHGAGQAAISLRVIGFTVAAAALVAVGAALLPFLARSGSGSLQTAARAASPGLQSRRFRDGLVVASTTLLLVLAIDGGVLIAGLNRLLRIDPGFDPGRLLTMTLSLPEGSRAWNDQAAFYDKAIEQVKALPGVAGAAVVKGLPLAGLDFAFRFAVEGQPLPPPVDQPTCQIHIVSRDYFSVMKIGLRGGRFFTANDFQGEVGFAPFVVINETMARRNWPNESAIGKRFRMSPDYPGLPWMEIAGVVADVKETRLDADTKPTIYYPQNLFPQPAISLLVRTESDPRALISSAVGAVRAIEPDAFVSDIRTMDEVLAASVTGRRFAAFVLLALGVVALALALAGIASVVAQSIVSRTREIGVRAALGARFRDNFTLLVGRVLILVLLGLAVGLPVAFGTLRLLGGLLYDAPRATTLIWAGAPLLILAAAFVACCLPARRLRKIDPIIALRSD
jgi:putative ABC transport system permease protein